MSRDRQMPEDFQPRGDGLQSHLETEAYFARKDDRAEPDPFPVTVQVAVSDDLIAALDKSLVATSGMLSREGELQLQALTLQLKVVRFRKTHKVAA